MPGHRYHLTAAVMLALVAAVPAHAATLFNGVAAGDADEHSAVLWTRAKDGDRAVALVAQVAADPAFHDIVASLPGATVLANDYTLKLLAEALPSGRAYYYRFRAEDGTLSPVGRFFTAPPPNQPAEVTFGFSGDADGRFRPYPSIRDIARHRMQFFVFLGDTMYETASGTGAGISPAVPTLTPASSAADAQRALPDYDRKYLENRTGVAPGGAMTGAGQLGLQPMFAATAIYTLLDNHELGNASLQSGGAPASLLASRTTDPSLDVNRTGAFVNRSVAFRTVEKAFFNYHPTRADVQGTPETGLRFSGPVVQAPDDPRTDGSARNYFAQAWGANAIYVQVDDRSYRDARLGKPVDGRVVDDTGPRADNPERTMLGQTQLAWLECTLLAAEQGGTVWKFVAISAPIDQVGASDGRPGTEEQDGKSWFGGFRAERNALLKFIDTQHIRNVVFLTTDDHFFRVTQLQYDSGQGIAAVVPACWEILAGPIGAGGPDQFQGHDFAAIQAAMDNRNATLTALHQPVNGLPAGFPGLRDVHRAFDPTAQAAPKPVDFFSPDSFNYAVLHVAADGTLTSACTGSTPTLRTPFRRAARSG